MSALKATSAAMVRAGIRLGFVLAVAGLAAGCGFHPLYVPRSFRRGRKRSRQVRRGFGRADPPAARIAAGTSRRDYPERLKVRS